MIQNFISSLTGVLAHEGGYVNNPKDPGGPTNKGITIATARLYISPTFTIAQLKALNNAQAGVVYKKQYADKVRFDELPSGVDYAAFDYAVNSGPGRPQNVLRALVGVAGKGPITDAVLAEIKKRKSADVINAICDERLRFMKALKTWSTFGAGWTRRVAEVRQMALKMALTPPTEQPAVPPMPQAVAPAPGKAVPSAADNTGVPTAGTVAGTGGAVVAAQTAFHFPWWGVALLVVGGLAVVGTVVALILRHKETQFDLPAPGTVAIPTHA